MPIQSYPTPYGGQLTTGSQAWANGVVAGYHFQGPNGGQRMRGIAVGPNGAVAGRHIQGPNGNQLSRGAVYNRAEDTLTIGRQAVIGGQTYQRHRTIQLP